MFINVEMTEFLIECMENTQLAESNFFSRNIKRYSFFLSFKYNKDQIQVIIDDYIEDFNIDGLKAFLFSIYSMTKSDKPDGFFRKFLFSASLDVRQSYFNYKKDIEKQINETGKRIYNITGNEDDIKLYDLYTDKFEELDSSENKTIASLPENPSSLKKILLVAGTALVVLGVVGSFLLSALTKILAAINAAMGVAKWIIAILIIAVSALGFLIGFIF
jgi:hypothetical protein